jgi:hypothetical protein
LVGVNVRVGVEVLVGDGGTGVLVAVLVGVGEGPMVAVLVGVFVGVLVGVTVGIDVFVGVGVGPEAKVKTSCGAELPSRE